MSSMLTSISMADVIDPDTAVLHIPRMIRQDEYGYRTSVEGKEVSPLTVVPLNQAFPISKSGGPASASFVLKRFADGYYVCSCPAWKFSTERDKMRKSCSHLKDVLGETYENDRIALAKEAKSTVFEHTKFRRTTSDGHHARHTHAKSMLDDHFRQLSQSQSDLLPTSQTNLVASSSVNNANGKRSDHRVPEERSASTSKFRVTPVQAEQDSDTETEGEEVVTSRGTATSGPSRLPAPAATQPSATAGRTRSAYHGDEDDDFGLDQDDAHASPSKRARRGKRSAGDSDDDKVRIYRIETLSSMFRLTPYSLLSDHRCLCFLQSHGCWMLTRQSLDRKRWIPPVGGSAKSSTVCVPFGMGKGSTRVKRSNGVHQLGGNNVSQRVSCDRYGRPELTLRVHHNCPCLVLLGLPKDITLDGELWMARGAFDQTSQICRTTVRLGRLRTFSHFLERDSMERQWLREQVGGRLASQDRLRDARGALSLLRSTGIEKSVRFADVIATASSTASSSEWKALKRSLRRRKKHSAVKSRPSSRFAVAGSFLRALFGRHPAEQSQPGSVRPVPRPVPPSRPVFKRCTRCGKVVKRGKSRNVDEAVSNRANADQSVSEPLLPSATSNSISFSSRRPHAYSTLAALPPGRNIPSAYTHVCRRKTKSSNEWNRIKFMVSSFVSLAKSVLKKHGC